MSNLVTTVVYDYEKNPEQHIEIDGMPGYRLLYHVRVMIDPPPEFDMSEIEFPLRTD